MAIAAGTRIVKFSQTGMPPVSPEETFEIMASMEAAHASKTRHGDPAPLEELSQPCRFTFWKSFKKFRSKGG